MLEPDYFKILPKLTYARNVTNCDFRFVLRNILYKAAVEAHYLSFQFEGDDSEEFERNKLYLEGVISDLPHMLDCEGNALHNHRDTISNAIFLSSLLIGIEADQTAGQLDMLQERLRNHRCRESRLTLTAA